MIVHSAGTEPSFRPSYACIYYSEIIKEVTRVHIWFVIVYKSSKINTIVTTTQENRNHNDFTGSSLTIMEVVLVLFMPSCHVYFLFSHQIASGRGNKNLNGILVRIFIL
jgi:hypothetical protein